MDVSPDGRHLAFELLGHIYEMPIEGGDAVALTDRTLLEQLPALQPRRDADRDHFRPERQ